MFFMKWQSLYGKLFQINIQKTSMNTPIVDKCVDNPVDNSCNINT